MARILVAEDDASMRQFIEMALTRAGHDVETAANGIEALRRIEQDGNFELLLADIVMPGMDGIELSQQAARLQPNIRVMFITGFAAVAMNGREAGPAAQAKQPVMSKPFHLKDLVDNVDRLLAA